MMNTMALARGDWTGEDSSTPPSLGIRGRFPRYAPRPYGSTVIELVASLGIPVLRAKPLLQASEDVVQRIRKRLGDHGVDYRKPFIVLNVGSRPGSAKGWQGWSELASRLKGLVPMIAVGGPGEQPSLASFAESLAGEVGEAGPAGAPLVLDAPVLDLAELAALCADCQVFVTADAGARHIASAAGARTLALFGPTDPRHTADHLAQCTSLSKPVACGPCHREVCNASDQLQCFRGIGSQRVAASVESILLGHSAPSA
jgi:heptosyltransferase-2